MAREWAYYDFKVDLHSVSGYPTLDRPKSMRSDAKEFIEKNTGAMWNKRRMPIDIIVGSMVAFIVNIITHILLVKPTK